MWPARMLAALFDGEGQLGEPTPRDRPLDRRWFRAHPERRHRCRWPDTGELEFRDNDRGAQLLMAIRHLGRGRIVYQPVVFQGALPKDERSAAVLFALAATSPAPIPTVRAMDVRLLATSRPKP